MRIADLIVYPSCRFADNLYPVKHRTLQQLVSLEARAITLCEAQPEFHGAACIGSLENR
jgi:hypothetical protein